MKPILDEGEEAIAAAYMQSLINRNTSIRQAATSEAFHAVLTNKRIILIICRLGAFKPLLENKSVDFMPLEILTGIEFGQTWLRKKFNGVVTLQFGDKEIPYDCHNHNKHL